MKSLGTKLAVISAIVLFGLMVTVGLWIDSRLTRSIKQQEADQALVHAHTLLASLQTLMLNGSGPLAREWLDRMKGTAGITEINVLRLDGREAFRDLDTLNAVNNHLGVLRFDREISIPDHEIEGPAPIKFLEASKGDVTFDRTIPHQLTVLLPIPGGAECAYCHGYDASPIRGILRLSLSSQGTTQRISKTREKLWMISAAIAFVVGVAFWLAVRLSVLSPIARLREAISSIGEGKRDVSLPVKRKDELGQVAKMFLHMQNSLVSSEERIRAVMDNVVDAVIMIDEHGKIESLNPAAERLFGYEHDELIGKNVKILAAEPHQSQHDQYIKNFIETGNSKFIGVVREVIGQTKDGITFHMDLGISHMVMGDRHYFVGIARDITSRKAHTVALKYQAMHDGLTDLPNRSLFYDRLEQGILIGQREDRQLALIVMDLDGFKEINDSYGHHVGDLVLQEVGRRLRTLLRESDTVARLGGDEFSVLMPSADEKVASAAAKKISAALANPIEVHEKKLYIGVSIGIALYPEHGEDTITLMQKADAAMYSAKKQSRGIEIYQIHQEHQYTRHWALVSELRDAIHSERLVLHYQPKIDLKHNNIYGVEALVRWNHPQQGTVVPEEFIPIAEQTGLIKPLTLWVLRKAMSQAQLWREAKWEVGVAINLSVRTLQDATFIDELEEILSRRNESIPLRIKLEITETSIMADSERFIQTLKRLANMGIRLSIDDFGIGYSSLSYLKQLPVDEIKIDKSFVLGMTNDEDSVVIVRSTIDLAHKLGLQVVAEGVESKAIYDLLSQLGCDAAQGYFISRPLPAEQLLAWANTGKWTRKLFKGKFNELTAS